MQLTLLYSDQLVANTETAPLPCSLLPPPTSLLFPPPVRQRSRHQPLSGRAHQRDLVAGLSPLPLQRLGIDGIDLVAQPRADQNPVQVCVIEKGVHVAQRKTVNPHPRLAQVVRKIHALTRAQ